MNVEHLVEDMIRGVLGAGRKRHHGALRALTGRGSLVNAGTLLAALGVAWGLYETATASATAPALPPTGRAPVAPALNDAPPPIPSSPVVAPAVPVAGVPGVPIEVARVIRLTVSAARADGALSPTEEAAILAHARQAGAEAVVADELERPTSLASLVAGAPEESRAELYTLAFTIVRADESVSGAERIYLAQLAHQLGLNQQTVGALEARAGTRIDASTGGPSALPPGGQ